MSEQVTDIAGWKKILTYTHGVTKALSFFVRVDDVGGTLLHDGIRGNQLLERVEGQRFVHVPDAELFRDPAREQQAIDAVLRWLQAPEGSYPASGPGHHHDR